MAGWESASRVELLGLVSAQAATIAELTATVAAQAERIADLEQRLGQNSRNSSRPPFSDALDTPPRSLRKKTGRRPGKQPGSPGAALRRVDDPDEVVEHVPSSCTGCGVDLAEAAAAGVVRRQVHDIPDVTIRVVEHRLHRRRCGCGCVTVAQPPAGVSAPVADGPNRRALAVYLVVFGHVPVGGRRR